jgi:hypothetical protein
MKIFKQSSSVTEINLVLHLTLAMGHSVAELIT